MIKKTSRKYYRDDELLIKVGNNIKECRAGMGISLKMLSVKSGIGYRHLNPVELGKVNFRISYLFKLAKILAIEPKKLLP